MLLDVGMQEVHSRAVSRQRWHTQEEDRIGSCMRVEFTVLFIGVPFNVWYLFILHLDSRLQGISVVWVYITAPVSVMIVCSYDAHTELNLSPFHIQSKLIQASQAINAVVLRLLISHTLTFTDLLLSPFVRMQAPRAWALLFSLLFIISPQKRRGWMTSSCYPMATLSCPTENSCLLGCFQSALDYPSFEFQALSVIKDQVPSCVRCWSITD